MFCPRWGLLPWSVREQRRPPATREDGRTVNIESTLLAWSATDLELRPAAKREAGGGAVQFTFNKRIFRPFRGKITGFQLNLLSGRTSGAHWRRVPRKRGGTSGQTFVFLSNAVKARGRRAETTDAPREYPGCRLPPERLPIRCWPSEPRRCMAPRVASRRSRLPGHPLAEWWRR